MRSAVDVNAVVASLEVGVPDLRHTRVQREMPCELHGGLRFISVSTGRALELEAAIVRDIDLLVRVINQEEVGAQPEAAVICGDTELGEIRGCEPRRIRTLDDAARINAVDAAAVVQ